MESNKPTRPFAVKTAAWVMMLVLLIAFGLGLYFNTIDRQESQEYVNATSGEASSLLEQFGDEIVILDVREDHEFAQGRIPGSVHIPLQALKAGRYKELDHDYILVVCRTGRRSAEASQFLIHKDFSFVYNLLGGIEAWSGEIEGD